MPYSDSTHFFDKLSYKKHLIPSYGLEDISFACFKRFLQFSAKQGREELFSPRQP
jgi:hypothetical protein